VINLSESPYTPILERKKLVGLLFLLECGLTLLTHLIYNETPGSDSERYISLARQYAHLQFTDPYNNCYGHPLYSSFLLIFTHLLSYNTAVIGLVQALLFSISSVLLVSELEKRNSRSLLGTLFFLFLVPEIHFFNGYVLTESLAMSTIIFIFYLSLLILRKGLNNARLIALSACIGLNVLNRMECTVILIPVFYLLYPLIKTNFLKNSVILLLFTVLAMQVNALRNYSAFSLYYPGSFNGGEVMYGGNNPRGDGSHHDFWKTPSLYFSGQNLSQINRILKKPECESCPQRHVLLTQLAFESWKNDPAGQLSVVPLKLAKNWLLPGMFDIYTGDISGTKGLQLSNLLKKENFNNAWYAPFKHLFYMIIHAIILVLIIVGIIKRNKNDRFQNAVLILLIVYLLFAIPFCALPRWHVCILPILLITFFPPAIPRRFTLTVNN
jgi:hypothetical protein